MVLKKVMDALLRRNIKVRIHINPAVPKLDNDYVMIEAKGKSCS